MADDQPLSPFPDPDSEYSERSVGQEPDRKVEPVPVILFVELPFWLMVPDTKLDVKVHGHVFPIEVLDDFHEIFVAEATDSRRACIHIGPADDDQIDPNVRRLVEEHKARFITRKCKTVLKIHSRCNPVVLAAEASDDPIAGQALLYLQAFCTAHLEVVNRLVQAYRLATYDFFPHEVSPWDVPIWLVKSRGPAALVALLPYATWDHKPQVAPLSEPMAQETYQLITAEVLTTHLEETPCPGEFELLDAINLMERGDYSGAVRRIATAIEALVESLLRDELLKHYAEAEVERRLEASRSDFPGRLRQVQKLSWRVLSPEDLADLEATRCLRHAIVHQGERVSFKDRGRAQRSVDTGRWIYNALENRPERASVREKRIGTRSIGRQMAWSIFSAQITPTGVVVYPPVFGDEDPEVGEATGMNV